MLPLLKRTLTITLDTDWIWRRLLPALANAIGPLLQAAMQNVRDASKRIGTRLFTFLSHQARADAAPAHLMGTRSMALVVLAMLLVYLVVYYAR